MSRAFVNGITIAYDDLGGAEAGATDPPLLLVHGHPFNRTMWRPQVERFASAGQRVIAPDLRGYGESTVVPGKTTLDVFARDLAGLLDHLGIDAVVIGGLSMGGQIVLEFHRLFPQRVRGLLLADTFAKADTAEGRKTRTDRADQIVRDGIAPYANEVLDKMVAPRTIAARPDVAEHVLGMMLTTSPEGAAAALRGRAERPDYTDLLPTVAVPTLVVVGSEDEFTPVSDAKFMHERVPGATLTIVDGVGHMPNLERPAEFNDALAGLLESVGTESGRNER
ncbi:alpha/beta fold hydrolase [Solihabitans fulvus]|uniref:Alpha/beta fold hydrolase n=1 Tax=Solihabitans fulvus TaxID=1892852 RepID=A0A5B2X0A8_9PSEU|nr:alpha/beta fold hydrolase [Solihabitans fulvus]KAA2256724.1 alpha/beta fold hydrolase [Solihabitans fulvus]